MTIVHTAVVSWFGMLTERGVFQNVNRGKQLIRYDGLRYGSITPTDMDGIIECHNSFWILYEIKMDNKQVPQGQRLLLERFIEMARDARRHGIAMIAEHHIYDTRQDIFMRSCRVRELITTEDLTWRPPKYEITVKRITDMYMYYFNNERVRI